MQLHCNFKIQVIIITTAIIITTTITGNTGISTDIQNSWLFVAQTEQTQGNRTTQKLNGMLSDDFIFL
jgi:hypothetical protein